LSQAVDETGSLHRGGSDHAEAFVMVAAATALGLKAFVAFTIASEMTWADAIGPHAPDI
jgi:hypothetical protein